MSGALLANDLVLALLPHVLTQPLTCIPQLPPLVLVCCVACFSAAPANIVCALALVRSSGVHQLQGAVSSVVCVAWCCAAAGAGTLPGSTADSNSYAPGESQGTARFVTCARTNVSQPLVAAPV